MKIDEVIKSKFQSSNHRAIVNLRYTSNFFAAKQNKFMAEFDLSLPQFNILRILRGAKKSITVNTVKDRMVEKSPNTTRLMDKLVEKGLIDRARCDNDRRVVYVEISEAGLNILKKIDDKILRDPYHDFSSNNLSEEEAELLSDLLDKFRGDE